ncbi:MAG: DUF4296 domain-containing protein [bacterium]
MKKIKNLIIKNLIIVSTLLLLFTCSKKNNVDSITRQKCIKVYTELIKLSEHIPLQSQQYCDSAKKIFTKYNFTKQDFHSCVVYYNHDPKRWETFFQTAYDTLNPNNSD